MRTKHKEIEFKISRRVLWVGLEAYPLQQVTRVRPIEITPNRKKMALRYVRQAGATAGLGLVGLVALSCLGQAVPPTVAVVFAATVLAVLVWHTVRLVQGLTHPPLHVLSVATAGTARAALVSDDKALIHDLTRRIVEAIDNPSVEFEIKVDNFEVVHGDKVMGDKFGGDRVEGDKILEGWS
jgi:hypothetical protein